MAQTPLDSLDVELTSRDVQSLDGPDAVAGFLAGLGYNTDARTVQTAENLGIAAEGTLRPIRHVELLADQEGLFQVYLFEVASVTVSHTRALARVFRNRAGNYLLVLTSDYERLDFVLLDKYLPAGAGPGLGQRQVAIRPRTLTVERRKPDRIHLRVLRRLSYTESDPFAQYEKLQFACGVADWTEEHFNNKALFSDYYLLHRLPSFPGWAEDPKKAYQDLRPLYQGASSRLAGRPESTIRQELLEPLFGTQAAGPIADEVEANLKKRYRQDSCELYDRLTRLFATVDRGEAALNVPVYNGGLFLTDPDDQDATAEAENARFLNEYKVPDRYLARAIDFLARDIDSKREDLVFIDYKSLGVRQLGSIYEGLLEFRLRIAEEKMAVVKGKKTEEVVPHREAKAKKLRILTKGRGKSAEERTIPKGEVYLENDKRERKATGSYYTPDHIVKYIVEHAVGPVIRERFESLRPKLREAQQKRDAFFKRQKALRKEGLKAEPESKADLIGQELVDELFSTKVLDPAMGSGHFLVEAVDFMTDKAIDFLNGFPHNPVFAHLQRMRETILREMDDQGISIDAGRLIDVSLLKRHVLKRCIYGVDLNFMAVELAKVSLWLDCFTLGAPLSFLDHHLRCGNSLIGVTVKEVKEAIEGERSGKEFQWDLFGSHFAGLLLATDLMRKVGDLSDVTSAQVQESRKEYLKASDSLAPFKRILDVYTSQWFGNGGERKGRGKKSKSAESPSLRFLRFGETGTFLRARTAEELLYDAAPPPHASKPPGLLGWQGAGGGFQRGEVFGSLLV